MPPDLEVCVWDEDADEYVPVADVVFEDGTSTIDLLTDVYE
jgi:hypothetical protein